LAKKTSRKTPENHSITDLKRQKPESRYSILNLESRI